MKQQQSLTDILQELAKESWRKGNDNLFLSIDGNYGAAMEPTAEKVKSLFLEILVAQKAHVLSSYKDEVDDEAREQNALYDYALFQLDSIGKKWEQL
jgi:hypothetical protein